MLTFILFILIYLFRPGILHAEEIALPTDIPAEQQIIASTSSPSDGTTTHIKADATTDPDVGYSTPEDTMREAESESPHLGTGLPDMFFHGPLQTALKPGDPFYFFVSSAHSWETATADFRELGLSANEPLSKNVPDGIFSTAQLTLPSDIPDGMHSFSIIGTTASGASPMVEGSILVDTVPPTGTLTATFAQDPGLSGTWTAHVAGTFDGTGSTPQIINEFTYGIDADGQKVYGGYTSEADTIRNVSSPFSVNVPVVAPETSWSAIGYTVTIADGAGNLRDIESEPVPIVRSTLPLIDHATGGSVIAPSNYTPGIIPAGVGIPHSLINGLAPGDYYAVVFFDGLVGCPTNNYYLNSFLPGNTWGYDVRGPDQQYTHAVRTSAGGCGQAFRVDPSKGAGWMWGALDPNDGTRSVIADTQGIPAFAICASEAACDTITPSIQATTTPPTDVLSSVLFLPGIKASRLYLENPLCLVIDDSCIGIPLWPPIADIAVPQLYMDAHGKSVHSTVYAKDEDIVSDAFGSKFYSTFVSEMKAKEAAGAYGTGWRFKPIAYDWRLSLPDIVGSGVERGNRIYYGEATDAPYIEEQLRELASTSPTGKVTILAHSNGGLVAKALMQKLGDSEASRLIDKVVLVDTPQSGAPRALGAVLYGDQEGLPGMANMPNILMSTAHAREFALNDPMAYHLLPSAPYSNAINFSYPLIRFGNDSLLQKERDAYGETISTAGELHRFLLAEEGGRSMPATDDLQTPNILNSELLSYAEEVHATLDAWQPPPGIDVYQIIGNDIDTISGIDIYETPDKSGQPKLAYRPLFTKDGDGTVTVPSEGLMNSVGSVHSVWVDLKSLSSGGQPYSHANIMEADEVQVLLKAVMFNISPLPFSIHAPPPADAPEKRIAFFLHSPVSISVTSADGKRTGVNSDGSTREEIPDSVSGTFGEVKYVVVPAGVSYTLNLAGDSTGSFTFDMEDLADNDVIATSTIANVPVTAQTRAEIAINGDIEHTSTLDVDTDGNGTTDFSISPATGAIEDASSSPPSGNPTESPDPAEDPSDPGDIGTSTVPHVPAPAPTPGTSSGKSSAPAHIALGTRSPLPHLTYITASSTAVDVSSSSKRSIEAGASNGKRATSTVSELSRAYAPRERMPEKVDSSNNPQLAGWEGPYANQLAAVPGGALMHVLSYIKVALLRLLATLMSVFRK